MDRGRAFKALLFPHIGILLLLSPPAAVLTAYSLTDSEINPFFAAASYALSAYTLLLWCVRAPRLVKAFVSFCNNNAYVKRWRSDERLRVLISLLCSFLWNAMYAVFQFWLGYTAKAPWSYSFAAYYAMLAAMRLILLHHTLVSRPREKMLSELRKYRVCGAMLFVINAALTVMIFVTLRFGVDARYGEMTAIAIAAYTFASLAFAITGAIRHRRYASPVFSASRTISLVSATVSMLTLEAAMLSVFGDASSASLSRILLPISGGAVSAFILATALYMTVKGTKRCPRQKSSETEVVQISTR